MHKEPKMQSLLEQHLYRQATLSLLKNDLYFFVSVYKESAVMLIKSCHIEGDCHYSKGEHMNSVHPSSIVFRQN